jgi:hypothetical protein
MVGGGTPTMPLGGTPYVVGGGTGYKAGDGSSTQNKIGTGYHYK